MLEGEGTIFIFELLAESHLVLFHNTRDVSPMTAYRDVCLALIVEKQKTNKQKQNKTKQNETLTHLTLTRSVQEENTGQMMLLGEMLKHRRCNLQFLR